MNQFILIGVSQITIAAYIAVPSLETMLVSQPMVLAANMITYTSNAMV